MAANKNALRPEKQKYIWKNKDRMAQWKIAEILGCGQSTVSLTISRMKANRKMIGINPKLDYDRIMALHKLATGKR